VYLNAILCEFTVRLGEIKLANLANGSSVCKGEFTQLPAALSLRQGDLFGLALPHIDFVLSVVCL